MQISDKFKLIYYLFLIYDGTVSKATKTKNDTAYTILGRATLNDIALTFWFKDGFLDFDCELRARAK
jgi:hypothetical protein